MKYFSFFFFLLLFIFPTPSLGAEFILESSVSKIGMADTAEITLFLVSQGETLNALEGEVILPDNIRIEGIRDGNSIISFWVERPKKNEKKISFAGIVPGGVAFPKAKIFSFLVSAEEEGVYKFTSTGQALLHDGMGTVASLSFSPFSLTVSGVGENAFFGKDILDDTEKPEPFSPLVGQEEALFDGKYFLTFEAQDKFSGIGGYEILEAHFPVPIFLKKWREAESPFLLEDQSRRSFIFVRASDLNGNTRTEMLFPASPLYTYSAFALLGILCILLFFFTKKRISL